MINSDSDKKWSIVTLDIFFLIIILILSIILFTLLFNSIFGPFLSKKIKLSSTPKVSILIPARNEEQNITHCLEHIINQDYQNIEIIILNDESNDRTAELVQKMQNQYSSIKMINGQTLPDDWTGKNWACYQLAREASGDILIFTDADTMHTPLAVSQTLGWMQKLNLGLLSSFPQQKTVSLAEKLIVPIIDFFVYGMLPLWSTYYFKSSAFAAANGQWIAFKKDIYQKIGGHESVKNEIVEDVELNRIVKKSGIRTLTAAGTKSVFCRMYHSPIEVWQGFSKNFYGLTGHSIIIFIIIEFILLTCCVLPFLLVVMNYTSIALLTIISLNLIIRAILSIRYKHPFFISVFLHPVSILFASIIGLNSFYQYHWGHIQWKNRVIQIKNTSISVK